MCSKLLGWKENKIISVIKYLMSDLEQRFPTCLWTTSITVMKPPNIFLKIIHKQQEHSEKEEVGQAL